MILHIAIGVFSAIMYIFVGLVGYHMSFRSGQLKYDGEDEFVAEAVDVFCGVAWPLAVVFGIGYYVCWFGFRVCKLGYNAFKYSLRAPNAVARKIATWLVH